MLMLVPRLRRRMRPQNGARDPMSFLPPRFIAFPSPALIEANALLRLAELPEFTIAAHALRAGRLYAIAA